MLCEFHLNSIKNKQIGGVYNWILLDLHQVSHVVFGSAD